MISPGLKEANGREAVDESADQSAEMPPSNRFIDALARVMPDLPMLGALMLLLVVYLAASGSDFGASQECFDALHEAQSAAASAGAIAPF